MNDNHIQEIFHTSPPPPFTESIHREGVSGLLNNPKFPRICEEKSLQNSSVNICVTLVISIHYTLYSNCALVS